MLPAVSKLLILIMIIRFCYCYRNVGMPAMRTVTIINPSNKNQIQLLSIRTAAPHFHLSPIKSKVSRITFLQCRQRELS